jgi:carbamoyltransferase
MNILGISCYYHDSAACLISNEKIYAAQEERFTRKKHSSEFPIRAINFCLSEANITSNELDFIVFYEKPFLKFWRVLRSFIETFPHSYKAFLKYMPRYLGERLILPIKLSDEFDYNKDVLFLSHHISHSSSAFFASPFEKAAIITADGIGEFSTLSISIGEENRITTLKEQVFPHSPGLIYSAFTSFLGFHANSGEGKVMALASYGKPNFNEEFKQLFTIYEDGSFFINKGFFDFKETFKRYQK